MINKIKEIFSEVDVFNALLNAIIALVFVGLFSIFLPKLILILLAFAVLVLVTVLSWESKGIEGVAIDYLKHLISAIIASGLVSLLFVVSISSFIVALTAISISLLGTLKTLIINNTNEKV